MVVTGVARLFNLLKKEKGKCDCEAPRDTILVRPDWGR